MATYRESIAFETREGVQVLDLTDCVTSIIQRSGVRDGLACVFTPSSASGS